MDGWCKNNLAILREDGQYSRLDRNGKGDHLEHLDLLNYKSGPKALKLVEKYKARIENTPALRHTFHSELERHVKAGTVMDERCLWDAESVFHEDFRQQANAALHKELKHVQGAKEIQKVAKDARGASGAMEPLEEMIVRIRAEHAKYASLAEIQAIGVARSLGSNIRGAKDEAPGIIASAKEMFPPLESVGN